MAPWRHAVRVSVAADDGRRSGAWRIWFGPRDIFIAGRTIGHIRKASIHYPREGHADTLRYVGFTKEHAESLSGGERVSLRDRMHARWSGYEFHSGYFFEYRIRFPTDELRDFDARDDGDDIYWLRAAPSGMSLEVSIISGPPTHVGPCPSRADGEPTEIVHEVQLENGRRVWVVAQTVAGPSAAEAELCRAPVLDHVRNNRMPFTWSDLSASARLILSIDNGDGTTVDAEFAPEFLRAAIPAPGQLRAEGSY